MKSLDRQRTDALIKLRRKVKTVGTVGLSFRAPEAVPRSAELIAQLKKKARERRMRQNKNRRRNSNMVRIPGVEVMQRIGKLAQVHREFIGPRIPIDHVIVVYVFQSTCRGGKSLTYRNAGKAAVRVDRKVRKERQRIQMKMRAAA